MTPEEAKAAAQMIAEARWATTPLNSLPETCHPATVEEGYRTGRTSRLAGKDHHGPARRV